MLGQYGLFHSTAAVYVILKRRGAESEEFLCDIQSHAKAFLGGRREAAQHSAYS